MANNARLYPYSLAEAQRQNEVEQWLDSRTDNARCCKSTMRTVLVTCHTMRILPAIIRNFIDLSKEQRQHRSLPEQETVLCTR